MPLRVPPTDRNAGGLWCTFVDGSREARRDPIGSLRVIPEVKDHPPYPRVVDKQFIFVVLTRRSLAYCIYIRGHVNGPAVPKENLYMKKYRCLLSRGRRSRALSKAMAKKPSIFHRSYILAVCTVKTSTWTDRTDSALNSFRRNSASMPFTKVLS